MATEHPNRQLLLGILALQMDFISRKQLTAATSAWLQDKSRPIEEILIEHGALTDSDCQLLVPLVERHIENHDGDPDKSLAGISSIGSVAEDLRSLGDSQIEASLSIVASQRPTDPFAQTVGQQVDLSGSKTAAAPSSSALRFRILRLHARGGLGEVSVAHDTELNREVALKEIQRQFADNEGIRSRFLLEAEVTGGLEHPGIVPVYGLGRYADGRPFYAMRFIKGDSLQEAADRFHASSQTPDAERTIAFDSVDFRKLLGRFIDVCDAIQYAHSRGVLHRDLKPGNIMLVRQLTIEGT